MCHCPNAVSPKPQVSQPGLNVDFGLAISLLETLLKLLKARPCHGGRGCLLVCAGYRHHEDAQLKGTSNPIPENSRILPRGAELQIGFSNKVGFTVSLLQARPDSAVAVGGGGFDDLVRLRANAH
jgi:hypothetical protein